MVVAFIALAMLIGGGLPTPAQAEDTLPPSVLAAIRKHYVSPEMETRYLDGRTDLNGDGRPEIVVHVVGPMACGTGGCPTLVFTPEDAGYRLVTTISVSRPPIRVSPRTTSGWHALIVEVGGGGGESGHVQLDWNGESYPSNPTVAPAKRVADVAGAPELIADFDRLDDAKPLHAAGSSASGVGPSFDCAKATAKAEAMVCGDAGLAALDRTLAVAYRKAMGSWPAGEVAKQRTAQRAWLAARNKCGRPECVRSAYQRRLIEVQITSGQLEVPTAIGFVCKGHEGEPFTAVFYNQTDPHSVVLTFGDQQVIAFGEPSGSGSKYTAPNVEYWEHDGEAAVRWGNVSMTCVSR